MICRVGHVGLRVPDLDRSVRHAEHTMGLREVERVGDVSYLTCNERHHELVLIEGEEVACDHLAFEVEGAEELRRLFEAVGAEGWQIVEEGPEETGLEDAFRFVGPGGFVFEIFHGMNADQPAHYDTVGVRPLKFEHITIKSSDKEGMEDLLIRVLGFRLSERAEDAVSWLRASYEHHGVSVIRAERNQLQHYAWQLDSWSRIKDIGDRLMHQDRTFLWGPGHHGIGDNYFCYFLDADGIIVEYSTEMLRIENDAAYTARTWPDEPLSVNRWGNPPPPDKFVNGGVDLARSAVGRG